MLAEWVDRVGIVGAGESAWSAEWCRQMDFPRYAAYGHPNVSAEELVSEKAGDTVRREVRRHVQALRDYIGGVHEFHVRSSRYARAGSHGHPVAHGPGTSAARLAARVRNRFG